MLGMRSPLGTLRAFALAASFCCAVVSLTETAAAQYAQPAQPGYAQPAPAAGYTYSQQGTYQQQATYPQQAYPQQGYQTGYAQPGYPAPGAAPTTSSRSREDWEIGQLYGVGALYGVGMGVWLSTELDIEDPGIFMIAPAILGVAGPVGVYFLDHPKMRRGMPMAITTGMVIGTGNASGLVIYQHASQPDADAWGFEELTRSIAIGSTVGAAGGYAAGYFLEPPPASGLLVTSGVLWGAGVGGMFGYGASSADKNYHTSNENIALGGLIGLNVGMVATGALTAAFEPSVEQVGAMWLGAGIGAAVSAPIYLLYIGDDKPPVKRGLLFTGTTTTLGIVGGAVLGYDKKQSLARADGRDAGVATLGSWGRLDYVMPTMLDGGMGLGLGGRLE